MIVKQQSDYDCKQTRATQVQAPKIYKFTKITQQIQQLK